MSEFLEEGSEHPLLSPEAAALDPAVLEEQALVAERVLGLRGEEFDDEDDEAEATRAVVLQVNYQVSLPPNIWALKSSGRGARSESYVDGLPSANPVAQQIVDELLEEDGADPAEGWTIWKPWR